MSKLGPFEPQPEIAVAVSGGSDSLALALLAHQWAKERNGSILALSVDHGLRTGSTSELAEVKRWMKCHGIAHRILTWKGEKPKTGQMAAARLARYALLENACKKAGILHLMTAHQREDQAETLLLRLARGSGAEGLAAMSPVLPMRHVRLLRPLLGVDRASLRNYLKARSQDWIEDPSNDNLAFERVRLRQLAPLLAELGLSAASLAASAGKLHRLRRHLEGEAALLLARHARLDALGFAWLARQSLTEPDEILRRALACLLASLSGAAFLPGEDQMDALLERLRGESWKGCTLAGCRLAPRQGQILIVREAAACQEQVKLVPGQEGVWDGRYRFLGPRKRGLRLGALGAREAEKLAQDHPTLKSKGVPALAWASLPALSDARGVFAVPALGYKRNSRCPDSLTELIFLPRRAVLGSALLLS
ncbi:MAG: tRNA lysidine(34) synthetase TilS [Alphaproteobacteria bacterium]|nr:tRNA lysidine(34) synthetase TilS [Alphaproteobacteria bacterium]